MTAEHELVHRVLDAQSDPEAADNLVRDYLPFIRAEAAKFLKRPPAEGEDALGIAMLAFYEAAMAYQRRRGPFLRLAAAAIRNRLIDAYRRERRHRGQASLDQPVGDGDTTLGERLAGGDDHLGRLVHAEAAREEIAHYAGQLAALGLSLSDVADSCPRQERTLRACMAALAWARGEPGGAGAGRGHREASAGPHGRRGRRGAQDSGTPPALRAGDLAGVHQRL